MDMDEDEVTREPFEDQNNDGDEAESVSSWQQPKYDSLAEHGDHHNNNDLDTTDGTLIEQEVDDDCSSADAEDVDYAKSFGIELKNPKVRDDYQRLVSSGAFQTEPEQRKRKSSASDAPPMIKTSTTSDCIYHKGCFYQKGDIVALCDQDDGLIYFAQLTGFLQDQYCEKSGSINWLVPIRPTSRKSFDPSAYRIGVEDVQLRKLDCMTFVCRCPHDYYLRKFFQSNSNDSHAPGQDHSLVPSYKKSNKDQTYIWTTIRPCSVPTIETRACDP